MSTDRDYYRRTPDEVIADGGPLHHVVAAMFAHSGGTLGVLNGASSPVDADAFASSVLRHHQESVTPASFTTDPGRQEEQRLARLEAKVDAILDEQQRRAVLDDYERLTAEWDRRHR